MLAMTPSSVLMRSGCKDTAGHCHGVESVALETNEDEANEPMGLNEHNGVGSMG